MFAEILIALLLGVIFGVFTGITPGVHINLISLLLLSISSYLLGFVDVITVASFIIAMAITHTFLDAIPSIFLGAPDSDMVLGVLPGHKMLLQGKGYEAVKLTVIGSLFALILGLAIIPMTLPFLERLDKLLSGIIGFVILGVVIFMFYKDKTFDKVLKSIFVFLTAGVLGILVLTMPNLSQPLFPMLSGLFGTSTLVLSMSEKINIPEQKKTDSVRLEGKDALKVLFGGTLSGILVAFLPGVGPAQAAIIGRSFLGRMNHYLFLVLVGGINTANMLFSIATLYALDKARNGAVLVIKELTTINLTDMAILLLVALTAGCIAAILTLSISGGFSRLITKVNYSYLCLSIIIFVVLLVIYFSGWLGFIILVVSTLTGIIPALLNVKRSHLMACLLLPVMLFYLL